MPPPDSPGPGPAGLCPVTSIGGYDYDCIHRSGRDWKSFSKQLSHVASLLQKDQECFGFLARKIGANELNGIFLKNIISYYELANSITNPAFAGGVKLLGTYGIPVNGIPIIISDAALSNLFTERELILHELAHLVGAIPSDGNDPTGAASMANTAAIDSNCAKTLNAK
jgi:hypothetical protein